MRWSRHKARKHNLRNLVLGLNCKNTWTGLRGCKIIFVLTFFAWIIQYRLNYPGVSVLSGKQMNTTCCNFNDFVKAMADETRQRILLLLQTGEMSESDIVAHFDLTQPTISHHLAVLQRANLVLSRKEGRHVFYRPNTVCVAECCSEILARFNKQERELPTQRDERLNNELHSSTIQSR